MIAEHERSFPSLGQDRFLTVYLDEIQLVDGWESLVHRLAETREMEVDFFATRPGDPPLLVQVSI